MEKLSIAEPKSGKRRGRPRKNGVQDERYQVFYIFDTKTDDIKYIGYFKGFIGDRIFYKNFPIGVKAWISNNNCGYKVLEITDNPEFVKREYTMAARRLGFKLLNTFL